MFKDLRTSTKLFLLCGAFVGSIILATYSLIQEKQIALEFVRKELVGTQYLEALRDVYRVILASAEDASQAAQGPLADAALEKLAAAEAESGGSLDTAELASDLAVAIRALLSATSTEEKQTLIVGALTKARNLVNRIGDESKLTLDPDVDSYYIQNIVVKRMPDLLFEVGELQSLTHIAPPTGSPPGDDNWVRSLMLDGMIRSTIKEIERDTAAAGRLNPDDRLQAIGQAVSAMRTAVSIYLEAASAAMSGQGDTTSLMQSYSAALESAGSTSTIALAELNRLLNKRLAGLLGKFYSSLLLVGLVAGLSLLFAVMAYRQIVRPLGQLESLADKVRETKDYGLRIDLDREDEIGRLATAFNAMLEELAAAREREIADQERNAAMQAELARVARLTTMGEMAASIAHEINQPLASVVNNANAAMRWLDRQPPNIEEVEAALRRIVNDGERGSGIIGSIRAMAKKGDRSRVEINLNELIYDVMQLSEGQFQRHGVSIRSELAYDLPRVVADRVQLQQVMLNLLMNAAEATLSVSDRERQVSVRSEKHNGQGALIAVEDSGTGIEPEDAKRIFDAFFTTKAEGMGMGLSICRSIVESHGGRITVVKAVPYGSVFQVILPGDRT